MEYWAKSHGNITIKKHVEDLLVGLRNFLSIYGGHFSLNEKRMLETVCKYHDFGKQNFQFQDKMYRLKNLTINISESDKKQLRILYQDFNRSVPHGYLSPCILLNKEIKEKFSPEELQIMISAVFYHHDRDLDIDRKKLAKVIKEDLQKTTKEELDTSYLNKARYLLNLKTMSLIDKNNELLWIQYAIIKGLLNRLDYWASSEKYTDFEINGSTDKGFLGGIIEEKMNENGWDKNAAQEFMKTHKNENIILVASTGSGKTEGAFMWADGQKVFYTLPLRVSINAIYKRITKYYRYPKEKTALIHSDAVSFLLNNEVNDNDETDIFVKNSVSRMFCRPVSVCTIDQLFAFVYKYMGSEMLLATLKYSRLVIDEIQAYSPDIIGKLICGLYLINKAGGRFAIMTATLPPVLKYFIDKEVFEGESRYAQTEFLSTKNRHFLRLYHGDFDCDFIAEKARNHSVLVICNTVQKAQEVFRKIKNICDCHLLHSRFTMKHKRMLEESIMEFSDSRQSGIWVSTQIVEASLDIDFDILFTEMCGADSLLQRLGRCYRKREYDNNEPNVFVYDTKNGVAKSERDKQVVYDKRIYDRSVELLRGFTERIFTEKEKIEYINKVFDVEGLKDGRYFQEIQECIDMNKKLQPGLFTKSEAKAAFRNITSFAYVPENIYIAENKYGRIDEIFERISGTGRDSHIAQKEFMDFTVNVSHRLPYQNTHDMCGIPLMLSDTKMTDLYYDFDEETMKGAGLTKEVEELNGILLFD